MKALLFAAIAVDVLASLYLALIAPIMIYYTLSLHDALPI